MSSSTSVAEPLIHRLIVQTSDEFCLFNSLIRPVSEAELRRDFRPSKVGDKWRVFTLSVDDLGVALITVFT